MEKIGILTLLHNSLNYGGVLQAYAMPKMLEKYGYDACQIDFDYAVCPPGKVKALKRAYKRLTNKNTTFSGELSGSVKQIWSGFTGKIFYKGGFDGRKKNFKDFIEQNIPLTEKVYNYSNIKDCCDLFDCFVVGSDIVWRPFNSNGDKFFFSFVPSNKRKISFAPSLGVSRIKDDFEKYKTGLKNIDYISVRENAGKKAIEPFTDKPVSVVLDPTLMLNENDYKDVVSERLIEEKYLFCYILGGTKAQKSAVCTAAKKLGLTLVYIDMASGAFKYSDLKFGDRVVSDAGPKEFLSLIKHADYVLTDSFHAIAFSVIFGKEFLGLKRYSDTASMSLNSRLADFLSSVGLESRYINSEDIEKCGLLEKTVDYATVYEKLEQRKKDSECFLLNALKD